MGTPVFLPILVNVRPIDNLSGTAFAVYSQSPAPVSLSGAPGSSAGLRGIVPELLFAHASTGLPWVPVFSTCWLQKPKT